MNSKFGKKMIFVWVLLFSCCYLSLPMPTHALREGCGVTRKDLCGVNIMTGEKIDFSPSMNYDDCGVADLNSADTVCCCPGKYEMSGEGTIVREGGGDVETPKFTLPTFQINIPTVKLSESNCYTDDAGNYQCGVPWISEYIIGVYNYGLSIAGILAAIILMAGGVLWLISAGDVSKITQAKELIIGSITGLIIMASSYILLMQINPELTKLKTITIGYIEKKSLYSDTEVAYTGNNPYAAECVEAKKGNLTPCEDLGTDSKKPNDMVVIDGAEVNSQISSLYQKAIQCVADKNGGEALFSINEGWRSPKVQLEYFDKYGAGQAATPCCSNHGAGQALDIKRKDGRAMSWDYNTSSGLTACMNENFLYASLPNEPWHWSTSGK